jgi:hypothetical protein
LQETPAAEPEPAPRAAPEAAQEDPPPPDDHRAGPSRPETKSVAKRGESGGKKAVSGGKKAGSVASNVAKGAGIVTKRATRAAASAATSAGRSVSGSLTARDAGNVLFLHCMAICLLFNYSFIQCFFIQSCISFMFSFINNNLTNYR